MQNRRKFLSKLSLGALSALGLTAATKSGKEKETAPTTMHPVISIHEMGFAWDTLDPFLFCVHHEDKFPKGNAQMGPAESLEGRSLGDDFIIKNGYRMYHGQVVPGFPGHPHRGFETVTVVRDGIVDHADSLGAAGRYGEGDVQWMTAGKGVQHSEMFPLLKDDEANPLELFQIWLNLPRKNKMVEPHFKMLWGSKIPKLEKRDAANKTTKVEIIAGTLYDHTAPAPPPDSWAADPANEVAIWNIKMEAGATFVLPKAKTGANRVLYFYEGEQLTLHGAAVSNYHSIIVKADMDLTIENGASAASILVLQGMPIGEPVIQYGPFVMNTKAEIQQAFEDFHNTQFGGWPWAKADQVHERHLGRFAKHADGTYEAGV
jgi:quercetin 2,3-dioxygenase